MPNYELPQVQNPDILGAYLRGQAAPGQLQLQQQQVQEGQIGLQQHQLALAMGKQGYEIANRAFGLGGTPGNSSAPQGSQPSQPPQQTATSYPPGSPVPSPSGDRLDSIANPSRLEGMAQLGAYNAFRKGDDPVTAYKEAIQAQADSDKNVQLRTQMALAPLQSHYQAVLSSTNPSHLLGPNPEYMQVWQKYAPHFGYNPNDPAQQTDDHVREVATYGYNQDVAGQSLGSIPPLPMPTTYTQGAGPGGSVLQTEHGGKDNGKQSELVGRTPMGVIAMNAPPVAATDPRVKAWMDQIHSGNATMQNVPAPLKTSVAEAMSGEGKAQYSPMASSRLTLAASRITKQFTDMSAYKLTADGKPYLERIQAALATPGSVSDQDLLDSLTKLNTGGNAVTDAQVKVITDGKSFSDMASTFANKFKNGGVLSPNQRQQISTIANAIYSNYAKNYQPIYEQAAKQLTDAGIPKSFWTIPDLNSINTPSASVASGKHPANIQSLLDKYK